MLTAKVTSKWQITLPAFARKLLGIKEGEFVGFFIRNKKIELTRVGSVDEHYGSIKVKGRQDFNKIRKAARAKMAERAAHGRS